MKVLLVNHTGQVSGGERSLLTLVAALRARAEVVVACPDGDLADALEPMGVSRAVLPGTAGSLKLHPRHTPVAVADLARAARALGRLVEGHRPDVVHANSIRAGIIACLPRRGARVPVVVHVRDCLPDSPVTGVTRRVVARRATATVGNSAYTLSRFALPSSRRPTVIYNPVDADVFDGSPLDGPAARQRLGLAPDAVVLGVLGQLTPWKGQDDAIRALSALERGDVHLLLAGSAKFVDAATRFDNRAYVEGLDALVAASGLSGRVHRIGERDDVPDVLRALDLLLLPSEEEPFGRALVEAMSAGVPVVATDVGGPPEIVTEGVDGLLVAPRRPDLLARAVGDLLGDRLRMAAMGRAGRQTARRRFGPERHADACLELYAALSR